MNKKELLYQFLKKINNNKYMPIFLKNIFDYEEVSSNNYISRCTLSKEEVILDIFDNISKNRFNRYLFIFNDSADSYKVIEKDNIFVHYIYVKNIINSNNKLLKFAYLFKISDEEALKYAKKFLCKDLINILIKGSIYK